MSEITAGLRQLHAILQQLRDVRESLDRGPKQIKAREGLLTKAEAEVAEKREALTQARVTTDRKSLDLKSNESKINDLKTKLNVATTNKEFGIIKGQIDADTVANSVLEDEIIESLEVVDRLQAAIGEATNHVEQTTADLAKKTEDVNAQRAGLEAQAAKHDAEIQSIDGFLTGEPRQKYQRLVATYGADALAPVDGKVCTSCYTSVTAQSKVLLNSGEIVFCSCGRLLYIPS